MSRATKKHLHLILQWETKDLSWDATIYHSGGVTHSVYVEAIDDDGRTIERYNKTFTGDNARYRAIDWAKKQRKYSIMPDSKWMV